MTSPQLDRSALNLAALCGFPRSGANDLIPIRAVLASLADCLADPEWHPTPEQAAEAQHALAQAPSCPQSNLFGSAK
jgi:hypothetical protein